MGILLMIVRCAHRELQNYESYFFRLHMPLPITSLLPHPYYLKAYDTPNFP